MNDKHIKTFENFNSVDNTPTDKKPVKADLAEWLVDENDDSGNDTYFNSGDTRSAITTDESFDKFMKDYTKKELIELINDFSDEGVKFLKANNLIS